MIEKNILEEFVNNGWSARKISKRLGKGLTTVRYWLNKHDIIKEKQTKEWEKSGEKCCPNCKETKKIHEFYKRRNDSAPSTYCIICTKLQTTNRMRKFKEKCVEYKGGKCDICGYDKYVGALEFHHENQKEKDFEISKLKSWTFDERIIKELDKCVILCSNCHKETHWNLYKERFNLV